MRIEWYQLPQYSSQTYFFFGKFTETKTQKPVHFKNIGQIGTVWKALLLNVVFMIHDQDRL